MTDFHAKIRWELGLAFAAASPFIFRIVGHYFLNCILQSCCRINDISDLKQHLSGNGNARLTMSNITYTYISWRDARISMGVNNETAILVASIRLIFWHLMQPGLYFLVFYAYWPMIDEPQRICGSIVAGRELIYFGVCLIGLWVNPVRWRS